MKYLYGNGTESDLNQNYLEFLRLALDFSVSVLQSESAINEQHKIIEHARATADIEQKQISALNTSVLKTLGTADSNDNAQITTQCLERLNTVTEGEINRALTSINQSLEEKINRANTVINQERSANMGRLEALLVHRNLPHSSAWIDVTLGGDGKYIAQLTGKSEDILEFVIELDTQANDLLGKALKIENIMPNLSISIMESGGWMKKKGTKVIAQKITKEYLHSLTYRADATVMELRNAITDPSSGYDIFLKDDQVTVKRINKNKVSDPITLEPSEAAQIHQLYKKINDAAEKLAGTRKKLLSAVLWGEPLATHPEPLRLVHWIIDEMTPVIQNIAQNSLAPGELVLKRVLSDDRREEIFVSKADLLSKLAPLDEEQLEIFAPLGLGDMTMISPKKEQPLAKTKAKTKAKAKAATPPLNLSLPPLPPTPKDKKIDVTDIKDNEDLEDITDAINVNQNQSYNSNDMKPNAEPASSEDKQHDEDFNELGNDDIGDDEIDLLEDDDDIDILDEVSEAEIDLDSLSDDEPLEERPSVAPPTLPQARTSAPPLPRKTNKDL